MRLEAAILMGLETWLAESEGRIEELGEGEGDRSRSGVDFRGASWLKARVD